MWGLLPILLAARGLPLDRIALVAAAYPAIWGATQLATGTLSDRWGRKWMIAGGMWVQAVALGLFVIGSDLAAWLSAAVLLGLGTALVYPTLLAAVSDVAHPTWRASAVGVYRLWRDGGYAVGARRRVERPGGRRGGGRGHLRFRADRGSRNVGDAAAAGTRSVTPWP